MLPGPKAYVPDNRKKYPIPREVGISYRSAGEEGKGEGPFANKVCAILA